VSGENKVIDYWVAYKVIMSSNPANVIFAGLFYSRLIKGNTKETFLGEFVDVEAGVSYKQYQVQS
jgi:hypothetical protein